MKKNKEAFAIAKNVDSKDIPKITGKEILKKIFWYALPFIMIDVFKSCYDFIDMVTLVKTMVNDIGYTTVQAEKMLIRHGVKRKKRKKVIDKVAATIILQAYLDSK